MMLDLSDISVGDEVTWTSQGKVTDRYPRDDGVLVLMLDVPTSSGRRRASRCIIATETRTTIRVTKKVEPELPKEPEVGTVVAFSVGAIAIRVMSKYNSYWYVTGVVTAFSWGELLATFSNDSRSFEVLGHA